MKQRKSSNRKRTPRRDSIRTKARILDSAEKLLAERGFQYVSQRAISEHSGVNLALINYHFNNTVGLLHAVFERRAIPINEHRNRLLDACEERAKKAGSLDADEIINAYLRPVMSLDGDDIRGNRMQQLFGRAINDSSKEVKNIIDQVFRDTAYRFSAMLRDACPELSDLEFHWRLICVFGAMIYVLSEPDRILDISCKLAGPEFDASDRNIALACTLPFLATGMSVQSDPKRIAKPTTKKSSRTAKTPVKNIKKRSRKTASRA